MDQVPLITATAMLIGLTINGLAMLHGWQGWLTLRLRELETRRAAPGDPAPGHSTASRIEIADLRERIRKLEAIAAGVDL